MEELKPGTILCKRNWNIYNMEYAWEFEKVKKVTPTGKIRLESGELLSSLEDCGYIVYGKEEQLLYMQDKIQECVSSMIRRFSEESKRLFPKLTIDDIIKIGNLFESLKLENIDTWGRDHTKRWYKEDLNYFIGYRNEFQKNATTNKAELETTKQCLRKILEEKEKLEELPELQGSVSYGIGLSIRNLRNVIELIDEKSED